MTELQKDFDSLRNLSDLFDKVNRISDTITAFKKLPIINLFLR